MAKGFTITPGLENMGAMKTGGQGSVYKGRRTGEIFTAVKLLPTPINVESDDNKAFKDFQNEVQKLKKVNEEPNPHIVKIISSGLSETGNFPYIEMEFVEGPDLQELLQPPHEPVFTIKEIVKVAEQLAFALAHCHKKEVQHGDIKSNNVKYNIRSGNYVLLDFGLAVMSEEQRRSSLRQAGAVEFMAPEQSEGHILFQSDIYSFGIILFELLTGQVPFPLTGKGMTARNNIMLAHLETPPPDALILRKQNLPQSWTLEKAQKESFVPGWILKMIYKCLEKKPESRFANGMELYDYILINRTHSKIKDEKGQVFFIKGDDDTLESEAKKLQFQALQYKEKVELIEKEIAALEATASRQLNVSNERPPSVSSGNLVSYKSFFVLLLLAVSIAAYSTFSFLKDKKAANGNSVSNRKIVNQKVANTANRSKDRGRAPATRSVVPAKKTEKKQVEQPKVTNDETIGISNNTGRKYKVKSVAYFYNQPAEGTQRKAFINHWNNAVLTPPRETEDFIYIVYKNDQGQVSKGWLRKKDLTLLND